ncbi:MAG: ferredoxin--NADP reductase [Myxococcales bacterium]|nr:ferredoxin--NADP reductase [Myxococcales bacterium]
MPHDTLASTPLPFTRGLPRGLRALVDQAQRDVTMIVRGLSGQRPPPYHARGRTRRPASPSVQTRTLRVAGVTRETADAVTIALVDPSGASIDFAPGQFFTVFHRAGAEIVARNYSASNAPDGRELHLTIKRVRGGRVSGALQSTRVGDALEVGGPYGAFVARPDASRARSIVLIGGGSGITPLMSIARAILAAEPSSRVGLVYGNRSPVDVIFARELAELQHAYGPARFAVRQVVQEATPQWEGAVGRVDADMLSTLVPRLPASSDPDVEYYVCGPEGMRTHALAYLQARDVPAARVHVESFVVGSPRAPSPEPARGRGDVVRQGNTVALKIAGQTHKIAVPRGQTILEAASQAGLDVPFSCSVGGCGACRVKLVMGEVEMDEPNCLTDEERAEGMVLCCVGRPKGACALEVSR